MIIFYVVGFFIGILITIFYIAANCYEGFDDLDDLGMKGLSGLFFSFIWPITLIVSLIIGSGFFIGYCGKFLGNLWKHSKEIKNLK